MNIEDLKNKIVIIKDSSKKSLLSKINKENKLINVKIITLNELKKKYIFDYSKETIFYVVNKYNVIQDIAKKYIENLYYLNDNTEYEKVNNLREIKDDLLNNNLIKENKLFKNFLKNKDIILWNLKYEDKLYQNIFDELRQYNNVISYDEESDYPKKPLYRASNMEEEVTFVASYICKLINEGIDINKIKLANVKDEYIFTITKVFKLFNIPVDLKSKTSIYGTKIVKLFCENYKSNINETIDIVKENLKDEKDEQIYKQIINIVNEYCFVEDYNLVKDFIFNDLKNIKIKKEKYKNMIRQYDVENDLLTDDYIILMNFNEGIIPINHKDEDYFNDKIKQALNQSTSFEQNKNTTDNLRNKIKSLKNLIVTYRTHDQKDEIYISSAYDKDLLEEKELVIDYTYSNNYNKIKLVSLKDEFNKFGTVTEDLKLLNTMYNEKYLSYDNKFKNIEAERVREFLNNKLTLSYSSINNYYHCAFRYYLTNVLKIDKYEDTFDQTIGNIFHKILSECFVDDYDLDSKFEEYSKEANYEYTLADKFFLSKVKKDLVLLIDTIKNSLNYTQLTKMMCEKEVNITINENIGIRFKGFIDKIMYDEFNGETIVCIIDYKTGNPNPKIENVKYGLDMQLPVYIYLIKNFKELENVKIGGFYLQKVLNNKTDIEEKRKELKLQGYTNSDVNIAEKVDTTYADSKFIKGLKIKQDGSFQANSKVISDEGIEELAANVESKIIEASEKVYNAQFNINPKQLKGKNVGCAYCKFKDICYMKHDNIEKLD